VGVSGVIPGRYAKQEKGFIFPIPRDVGRNHAAQLGAKAKFSVLYLFFRNRCFLGTEICVQGVLPVMPAA
jgi:hypothetical protein